MEIEKEELKEKDIVLAKIKGYLWWPGIIKNIVYHPNQNNYKEISKNKKYIIDFIGNKLQGEVNKNEVKSFINNYEEYCKTNNPSLIKSIILAKNLYQEKENNQNYNISEGNKNKYLLLNKKRKESKKEENKKHDIKINININVTNNNQRTVNINSFSNINKGRKYTNKKKEDEEYIFEEEEYDNENEDINDLDLDLDYDEESLQNELNDIKICNSKTYHNNEINKYSKIKLVKGLLKENRVKKYNKKNEIINLNKEKDVQKDVPSNEELNKIMGKLLNYQIQLSNTLNQKLILEELNNLQIIIQNENNINVYYNELYKILSTFTYNKNSDIVLKSTDILSNLTHKIIKDLFFLSEEDKYKILNENNNKKTKYLKEIKIISNEKESDEEYLESKKISDLIPNKINNNFYDNSIHSKISKKFIINKEKNNNSENDTKKDELIISLNNKKINNSFSDNIINIVINDLKDNFYHLSEHFFKNIYNKNNIGLKQNLAIKRKHLCIKLLSLFKKAFPKLNEEYLKKIIVFLEYKIRIEDPSLGKKYKKEMEDLCHKLKNIKNGEN